MCLIIFAHQKHPRYRLVLTANRDEFYRRPTTPASPWKDVPDLVAGRDEQGGGTWLGITRHGRWSAITNFRSRAELEPHNGKSRGMLVLDLLRGDQTIEDFFEKLSAETESYRGFNLLGGDADSVWYYSNRNGHPKKLEPGYYGLSNHLLDIPWPKVANGKKAFITELEQTDLNTEKLFHVLTDTSRASDDQLPETGFGIDWERILSSRFIQSPDYGTRSSTILMIGYNGIMTLHERTYAQNPDIWHQVTYQINPLKQKART